MMKTPEYYLDEVAKERGYNNFADALKTAWLKDDYKTPERIAKESMLRHAKEACKQQKKICSEEAKVVWNDSYCSPDASINKQSILNARTLIE